MRLGPRWVAQLPETTTTAAPNRTVCLNLKLIVVSSIKPNRLFGSEIDCGCTGEWPYLVPPVLILFRSQEVRIVALPVPFLCELQRRNQYLWPALVPNLIVQVSVELAAIVPSACFASSGRSSRPEESRLNLALASIHMRCKLPDQIGS